MVARRTLIYCGSFLCMGPVQNSSTSIMEMNQHVFVFFAGVQCHLIMLTDIWGLISFHLVQKFKILIARYSFCGSVYKVLAVSRSTCFFRYSNVIKCLSGQSFKVVISGHFVLFYNIVLRIYHITFPAHNKSDHRCTLITRS